MTAEGADELIFLDITATHEARDIVIDMVRRVADTVFIPFTVGGGIRTVDDMRALLLAGADKVSINSAAVKTPGLITEAAERFGSQCIVVAIDARRRQESELQLQGWGWDVYVSGGRIRTDLDAVAWAREVERRGAGEILLTSMDGDGTEEGYDVELTRAIKAMPWAFPSLPAVEPDNPSISSRRLLPARTRLRWLQVISFS